MTAWKGEKASIVKKEMSGTKIIKYSNRELPSNFSQYLEPVLSPTSPGTEYWESPPPSALNEGQVKRITNQVLEIIRVLNLKHTKRPIKSFLDIGTGNGFIPRLLLGLGAIERSVGCDPYLDGEHKTSWQPHDHTSEYQLVLKNLEKSVEAQEIISKLRQTENKKENIIENQNYQFHQIGIHELDKLSEKHDFLYCKALEHIHDWRGAFSQMSNTCNQDGLIYIKHRSFFSYLGAHRYASIGIPWGHVLLKDEEYKMYVHDEYPERAHEMCDFFFKGLSYPRHTIGEMILFAAHNNCSVLSIEITAPKYSQMITKFYNKHPFIIDQALENYPQLSVEEMFSGICHIVFRKN